jgi:hypothetical protein
MCWVRREAPIQNPKVGNSIVDVCIIGVAQRARGFDAVVEVESSVHCLLFYSRLQYTKMLKLSIPPVQTKDSEMHVHTQRPQKFETHRFMKDSF